VTGDDDLPGNKVMRPLGDRLRERDALLVAGAGGRVLREARGRVRPGHVPANKVLVMRPNLRCRKGSGSSGAQWRHHPRRLDHRWP